MMIRSKSFFVVLITLGLTQACADSTPVASVNGKAISKTLMEYNVGLNTQRGIVDNDALRKVLLNELVMREVLAQEAESLKLDQNEIAKIRLEQARKVLLSELLIENFTKNNKVSETDIKAEYKRQIDALKDSTQYNLSVVVTASKEEAEAVIAKAKAGSDFAKLAEESSMDQSAKNGGDLGWVLPDQVIAPVSNVMVNLSKGGISAMPIQTRVGWHVIKLEDTRKFVAPKLDDVKAQLEQGLMKKRVAEYLQKLRNEAKIK
jgi:peptidyl-prolyl cis-trans isomerase C